MIFRWFKNMNSFMKNKSTANTNNLKTIMVLNLTKLQLFPNAWSLKVWLACLLCLYKCLHKHLIAL